jgi:hypothetical protein
MDLKEIEWEVVECIKKFYVVPTLRLCVLYGSQNKQQLLPLKHYETGFYNRSVECLQRGTH